MSLSNAEKDVLSGVGQQIRDIASGMSGNRRRELERNAGLLDSLVDGAKAAELAVDPATAALQAAVNPAATSQPETPQKADTAPAPSGAAKATTTS